MNLQIMLLLGQDGITNGAIYALLALALVLVFTVTRVIYLQQGEFVAFGALTLASFQSGQTPGTLWLLVAVGAATCVVEVFDALRAGKLKRLPRVVGWNVLYPALAVVAALFLKPMTWPMWVQVAFTLAVTVPLGPMTYRLAYQPLAEASVLVLLIVSVAVHFALAGLSLYFFGADGARTPAFSDARFDFGMVSINGQSVSVVGASLLLIVVLYFLFGHTVQGKALRATAINRIGARLMGISTVQAGKLSFLLATFIGVLSGIMIAPITTVYYDTGFLVVLKGFVGAIVGGLASYPLAAAGALLVGFLESYSSFYASAFKEVIVFTLIIPVLIWRSLATRHVAEDK
jgi:branched-chain amino acid transport system permease protein